MGTPGRSWETLSPGRDGASTVGQKCVHVFLLLAIRSVVIPGEDPESRVRFDTLVSAFAGMT